MQPDCGSLVYQAKAALKQTDHRWPGYIKEIKALDGKATVSRAKP